MNDVPVVLKPRKNDVPVVQLLKINALLLLFFMVDGDVNLPVFLVDGDIDDPEIFPFFLDNSLSLVNKEKRCLSTFFIRHKLLLNNELDKRSKQ